MRAEAPANRSTIFGNPVAAELVKIVDPVRVDLRPDKDVVGDVKADPCRHMQLKMIRTFDVLIAGGATGKGIAEGARVIEFHIHAAKAAFELRHDAFEPV